MRRKRRQRKRKQRLLVLASIILLAVGICAGAWWAIARRESGNGAEAPDVLTSPYTKEIMVMGVDPRTDDTGRSDTLFLVSLDEEAKRASILSIPRDTRVEMEQGIMRMRTAAMNMPRRFWNGCWRRRSTAM